MDYTTLRDNAASTIAAFGMAMTLREKTSSGFNPVSSSVSNPAVLDHPCSGIVGSYSVKDIDGSRVRIGDKRVTLNAGSIPEPSPEMVLVIGAEVWNIVKCDTVAPAGVAVAHIVQVRK